MRRLHKILFLFFFGRRAIFFFFFGGGGFSGGYFSWGANIPGAILLGALFSREFFQGEFFLGAFFLNITIHKKTEFHPLIRRYIFRKTIGGIKLTPSPQGVLGLNAYYRFYAPELYYLSFIYSESSLSLTKIGKY